MIVREYRAQRAIAVFVVVGPPTSAGSWSETPDAMLSVLARGLSLIWPDDPSPRRGGWLRTAL